MQERTRELDSWEQFIDELKQEQAGRCIPGAYISSLLFRGHGNSEWKLETTLERQFCHMKLIDYYRIVRDIQPKLETLAGAKWDTPSVNTYAQWARDLRPFSFKKNELFAIPYLAYLRHHGFPSPLLDWTRSPYVAAFFAFRAQPNKCVSHVSIYAYLEWANSHKTSGAGPAIHGIGSNFAAHKRHFAQQSEYTVCILPGRDEACYESHQAVFDQQKDDQDLLWKFTIPVSERVKVLTQLGRMNINAFSLFGSDDSLLEEIATSKFVLGQ